MSLDPKTILILCVAFFCQFCNVANKNNREQRVMNNIVYELMPYKSDNPKQNNCTFKFVISEKMYKGKIADWYKPANYNKLLFYINKQLTTDFTLKQDDNESVPAMIYFEPNLQMTNKMIFLIAFDNVKLDDDTYFEFNDYLFINGKIKFNITNNFNI